jgi:DNA-binding NarL/FixJ family response regulator
MITPETLRIAVVEDDLAAQEALRLLIDGTHGFRCVGAYGSAELALEELDAMPGMPGTRETPVANGTPSPDVLLLDINLPGIRGSEAARYFHERHPAMVILMLTLFYDEDRIFEALCNGATGYLLKKTPPAKLLEAVREARERGAPLSPDIAYKVVRLFRVIHPPARAESDLTRLELRLLSLLGDGYSYASAAEEMRVAPGSIPGFIRSIYGKLHVHSKSEAVGKALRDGLI